MTHIAKSHLTWGHLINLKILHTLHKAKTYSKILAPLQIITTIKIINQDGAHFANQKDQFLSKNDLQLKLGILASFYERFEHLEMQNYNTIPS